MSAFPPFAFASWKKNVSRREFMGSAAAAAIALPAGRVWADATAANVPISVAAVDLSGKPITLTASDIKDLRAGLSGQLLLAKDTGYDQARRNPGLDYTTQIERYLNG